MTDRYDEEALAFLDREIGRAHSPETLAAAILAALRAAHERGRADQREADARIVNRLISYTDPGRNRIAMCAARDAISAGKTWQEAEADLNVRLDAAAIRSAP